MDAWTLAYLAGHRDMSITKRYIHPQQGPVLEAMKKVASAQGGHTFGHTQQSATEGAAATAAVMN
jgi:hypothetical protein